MPLWLMVPVRGWSRVWMAVVWVCCGVVLLWFSLMWGSGGSSLEPEVHLNRVAMLDVVLLPGVVDLKEFGAPGGIMNLEPVSRGACLNCFL